jgi:hypothetical protein
MLLPLLYYLAIVQPLCWYVLSLTLPHATDSLRTFLRGQARDRWINMTGTDQRRLTLLRLK